MTGDLQRGPSLVWPWEVGDQRGRRPGVIGGRSRSLGIKLSGMREVFSRSRVTLRCQILETGGESYRLRDAKRRRRGPAAEVAAEVGEVPAGNRQ